MRYYDHELNDHQQYHLYEYVVFYVNKLDDIYGTNYHHDAGDHNNDQGQRHHYYHFATGWQPGHSRNPAP